MKLYFVAALLAIPALIYLADASNNYKDFMKEEDLKKNEFADFDIFDEDDDFEVDIKVEDEKSEPEQPPPPSAPFTAEDVVVEDVDDFDHFDDEDEFEGYETTSEAPKKTSKRGPEISIVQLPGHVHFNYYVEVALLMGILIYFTNFIIGKHKNSEMVTAWFNTNKSLLNDNFAFVGDDGKATTTSSNAVTKESEHLFTLWCSGRTCCEGMLVELKFQKRQDLISVLSNYFSEKKDQIHIKFSFAKEDMDNYVFCVASKKNAGKLVKEMVDLSTFCPERRPGEKYELPSSFNVMSEINEVAISFLDAKTISAFNRYADLIDYVHISDRYSGPKSPEDNPGKQLEFKRMFLIGFSIPDNGKSAEEVAEHMYPLMTLVFYWLEKIRRFRLSKEGKQKTDKNRTRIEEAFLKTTHLARNEAAAARREEKKRKEKERILQEDDPDKQRKWEEKEMKKQMKKKIPKMKQLKVKSL
ncbi:PAT complex subunit CCDC47 [Planococcus citri]|uniref:PAT complex subunit CCDC47 n=1 Tax=Planococcus citri TaxID=170843 RepID=UPI0031F8E932